MYALGKTCQGNETCLGPVLRHVRKLSDGCPRAERTAALSRRSGGHIERRINVQKDGKVPMTYICSIEQWPGHQLSAPRSTHSLQQTCCGTQIRKQSTHGLLIRLVVHSLSSKTCFCKRGQLKVGLQMSNKSAQLVQTPHRTTISHVSFATRSVQSWKQPFHTGFATKKSRTAQVIPKLVCFCCKIIIFSGSTCPNTSLFNCENKGTGCHHQVQTHELRSLVTWKIVCFCCQKMICIGSTCPNTSLFNCEKKSTGCHQIQTHELRSLDSTCVAVLPFQPKYRLAHPGNHLFSLSKKIFSGSKYTKKNYLILKKEALVCRLLCTVGPVIIEFC